MGASIAYLAADVNALTGGRSADYPQVVNALKKTLVVVGVLLLILVVAVVGYITTKKVKTDRRQDALAAFYQAPSPLPPGKPGDIIRSEPLTGSNINLVNAKAYRVLYRTENPDGTPRVSGGMLFVPDGPAPSGGRKVISWAHPTVGMGDACAPSRSATPTKILDWLQGMLNLGWVVTATDYAGLGTDGTELYLIGQAEARDVVNAVRMAQRFPGSGAGSTYGVFGHSQGGHAAMWAGAVGPTYAPELKLVGVSGAAPASELPALVDQLWNTGIAWVIGSEVFVSYPAFYPGLKASDVSTSSGLNNYQRVAEKCLIDGILEGKVLQGLGESVFTSNPMDNPAWAAALKEQTAPPLPASMPVQVVESVNDGVVLPVTIASMQQQWCAAGSKIAVNWMGPLRGTADTPDVMSHMYEGSIGGSLATSWFEQRFQGLPAPDTCSVVPPLAGGATMPGQPGFTPSPVATPSVTASTPAAAAAR